jgi:hypothetical protein
MDINEATFWNLNLCKYYIVSEPSFPVSFGFYVSLPGYAGKGAELVDLLDDNINLVLHNSTNSVIS